MRKAAGPGTGGGGWSQSKVPARRGKGLSSNIVAEATPELMAGDNPLEKEVNAYLTKHFIISHDVPDDECLPEAREVIRMVFNAIGVDLVTRLHKEAK